MTMHYKTSGVWKEIIDPQVKVSGVWKEIIEGWVNIAGVWKQFFSRGGLPEDLIAFSTDTDVSGWLKMDGIEASPTLIGKYPKVASGEGGTGGALTHTHNSFVGNTDAPATTGGSTIIPLSKPHSHTMNHTHSSNINNEPEYLKILPVTNGDEIKMTMFLFYDGASAPSGWSVYSTAYNKLFKGNLTPGGVDGNASHSHTHSGNTGATNPVENQNNYAAGTSRYALSLGSHTHTMNHTHSGGNNYPEWHGLLPVIPDSDTSEIPSGICAFFKGSVIPDGWSYFSIAEGKWIQGKSTNGATGGANTHNHVHSGDSGYSGPNTTRVITGGVALMYMISSLGHLHSISHTHNTVSNEPPYQELMFLKKD